MKLFTFLEFSAKMEEPLLGKKFCDIAMVAISPDGSMSTAGMMQSCPHSESDPGIIIALLMVGIEATAKKLETPAQKAGLIAAIKAMALQVERG